MLSSNFLPINRSFKQENISSFLSLHRTNYKNKLNKRKSMDHFKTIFLKNDKKFMRESSEKNSFSSMTQNPLLPKIKSKVKRLDSFVENQCLHKEDNISLIKSDLKKENAVRKIVFRKKNFHTPLIQRHKSLSFNVFHQNPIKFDFTLQNFNDFYYMRHVHSLPLYTPVKVGLRYMKLPKGFACTSSMTKRVKLKNMSHSIIIGQFLDIVHRSKLVMPRKQPH